MDEKFLRRGGSRAAPAPIAWQEFYKELERDGDAGYQALMENVERALMRNWRPRVLDIGGGIRFSLLKNRTRSRR